MADLPTLQRIVSLQKMGIFDDYHHSADVPNFLRYNLIYGFNGTGKTTLSRLFRGLDAGDPESAVPAGGRFTLNLTDGRSLRVDRETDALVNHILVFNSDFVDENLSWSDGRVNPVFYLGRDTSRRAELLDRVERRIPIRDEQRRTAQTDFEARERELETFYTDTARLIAETLGLGRQYDARHLKRDYASGEADNFGPLGDEEREDRKKLINQANAYDRVEAPELDIEGLRTSLSNARAACETTITGVALAELENHPSMARWLKEGFDYHDDNDLKSCLFCGNELPPERMEALQSALDQRFEEFFSKLHETGEQLAERKADMDQLRSTLPNERAVTATVSRSYKDAVEKLQKKIAAARTVLDAAVSAVSEKVSSPNTSNWPDRLQAPDAVSTVIEDLEASLSAVTSLIDTHNTEQNEFGGRQQRARDELKFALIIEHAAEHDSLAGELEEARKRKESRKALYEKARQCAADLRTEVRDHGPAVEKINALLKSYLGHDEIQLEPFEDGYRILRYGKVITGPLSEGERTAIALCYFLSKLQEEGRDLKNQIVVIDDPVSSLDAGSMNYAFNLLKGMLQDAAQLLILTHSLPFMNETKKWLKKPRERGEAAFLYVHAWHNHEHDRRHAAIREMPKLLRGYDSEYHYIFSLVRICVVEGAESENIPGYIMPNVMRRVLELFLAFKIPDSSGLGNKINHPLVQGAGLDQTRLQALNRLTQVESHSDNLDDFIGFSAMTIEETQQAAEALLKLIESLDKDHYVRLCELAD